MRLSDSFTVAVLRDMEKDNPDRPQYIHRMTARTYDAFVDTLYTELYSIVKDMEHDANHMQSYGENALNADVCRQLRRLGYEAINDKNNRGHADITVEYAGYTWIGEGKIVKSADNTYLKKGYDQILYRYLTGKAAENKAALLIYVYAPDSKHVMAKWWEYLEKCNIDLPGYAENLAPCAIFPEHVFTSQVKHKDSGSAVFIRHVSFSLHWAP